MLRYSFRKGEKMFAHPNSKMRSIRVIAFPDNKTRRAQMHDPGQGQDMGVCATVPRLDQILADAVGYWFAFRTEEGTLITSYVPACNHLRFR